MTQLSFPEQFASPPTSKATVLRRVADQVLWLSTAIVDAANRGRPNNTGVKVGGHQASSASMVDIMVALWFHCLTAEDRVSVKPHAAPVLHAINYLLGDLDPKYLPTLREKGGLQSYPSRLKDPDSVDFSTGSVGIGATAALWAAMSHRYVASHFPQTPRAGRFISLLGDAELDEGAIWEAVADPSVASLGELMWVVDLNRQSLDRVVPDIQTYRLQAMFAAAGWQVITLPWGRQLQALFARPAGEELRARLTEMPNEEYQRILRAPETELHDRVVTPGGSDALRALVASLSGAELAAAVRDLGGHDLELLVDTFDNADPERPTVVFAYTIKGNRLPTEGHPNNHSALLSEMQMHALADSLGMSMDDPWRPFDPGTPEHELCRERSAALQRTPAVDEARLNVPTSLGHPYRKPLSTQAALGRLLADTVRDAPEVAQRLVTCSPDVASSTNLGGWINKTGVWTAHSRHDWFADDPDRVLRWSEQMTGQHIELGIAEVNLVGLLGELGTTWSRWGQRLIPVATLYDPFVGRALEPWSYGIYAGGQSILVGTPSGVTLAPEGGAHQSITTPSIGLEQPGCVAWEPAFAQDLEWTFLHAIKSVGVPGGTSHYFRLSTRPIPPELSEPSDDRHLMERRRRQAISGGYRLRSSATDDVTLVGVGAIMPEVIAAANALSAYDLTAGVVCLTSPDLVFRSLQQRGLRVPGHGGSIVGELFPATTPTPIVAVLDGHPHTLAFLAGVRGDPIRSLGVTDFGQSSALDEAYQIHGIDAAAIVDAALGLLNR
ncbi:transketolase-like TK C-terminal-containing protein [Nocardioides terrisoli]|uniref:transketolase-like TK C-terminal-containing protein n=1 Tax=Nocardioides terrisoli TaxID=3388267 RepID=UPI00287BB4C9|nr:1-deoxy-D-xylulose-5-phosphate synthase N-terminal domain-containing protein [Nocardioides marmorisolisilvae]